MKILIDIGHPAHIHLFKHFAWAMQKKGHAILFTSRDKEVTIQLLKAYKFKFFTFGKPHKKMIGKIWGLIKFDFLLYKAVLKFNPDILLSAGSIYAAQVAFLIKKPHISLEDTGNHEQVSLYKPFTEIILTSNSFHKNYGSKQIKYNGYHELAYLHPHYFSPDSSILKNLGVKENEKFVILRFVSWHASHDSGQAGLLLPMKRKIVKEILKYVKLFISSEDELPGDLQPYQMKIPPEKIHEVLAQAALYLGEGATISSECAMLGTPAIYVNSITAGTLEEQERYGLLYSFRNSRGVLEKALALLNTPNLRQIHQRRRQKMLADKIDVTAFLIWFIETHPQSIAMMKENPEYQYRFKRDFGTGCGEN
ncbi:MAG TPA: DUF354 domain-containing protein [Candidatus Kapabacteria bacterium]|nr:DUF354 domain-containing protein [Candidatus Kapabacteria bacterium]